MALSANANIALRNISLQGAGHGEGDEIRAAIDRSVAGLADGYKIARGTVTLDGTNPTGVDTGLAAIVCAVVTLKADATPGDDPTSFSVNYAPGDPILSIYAYKTNGTDPTLVDSTNNAATVNWIAIGT